MKVIIDRATWNAGHRLNDAAKLLDADGARCCLGFLGTACGGSDEQLLGVVYPRSLASQLPWPSALFSRSSWGVGRTDGAMESWETFFATLNDSRLVPDDVRESWIAEGFRAVLGVDVEFV